MHRHVQVQDIHGSRATGILPALATSGTLATGLFRRMQTGFGWRPATMGTGTTLGTGVILGVIGTAGDDRTGSTPRLRY